MAEYTVEIKPPEKVELTIAGAGGQQLELKPGKWTRVTFDYEGEQLIFQGKKIQFVANLKTISDAFWMILALSAKGFQFRPNEPREILKKLKI